MTQEERSIEQIVHDLSWEMVALEPDPAEVEAIDRQVPPEWTQTLEHDQEQEFDQEVLDPLLALSDDELQEQVREALIELDMNMHEIMKELDAPEQQQADQHLDLDFDR
jgi:hypothetical protein